MSSSKNTRMFISKEEIETRKKQRVKSPLTKEKLVKRLAVKYDLPQETIDNIIKDFFLIISRHAKEYSHVSFYGFGTFREKKAKPKYVKIPGKEKKVKTREKNNLVFKSSFEI